MAVRMFSSRVVGERSGGDEVGENSRSDGISGAGGPGRAVGREGSELCGVAGEAGSMADVAEVGEAMAGGAAFDKREDVAEAVGFWVERGQRQKSPRAAKEARHRIQSRIFIQCWSLLTSAATGWSGHIKPRFDLEKRPIFGKTVARLPGSRPNQVAIVEKYWSVAVVGIQRPVPLLWLASSGPLRAREGKVP